MDIRNMRVDYRKERFTDGEALENPIEQFKDWFEKAKNAGVKEPNIMHLATVNNGKPSIRILLLKQIIGDSFVFFTNYMSRKGKDIEHNPNVAMNFYWEEAEKQIRIEGKVVKVEDKISEEYFAMRNRDSQIGAWASKQSEKMEKEELLGRIEVFAKEFEGREVPRPPHWGGYALEPDYIEFWQGGANRIHDRIVYEKVEGKWKKYRIAP